MDIHVRVQCIFNIKMPFRRVDAMFQQQQQQQNLYTRPDPVH